MNNILCLPEEIKNQFCTIAENIGKTHRMLGRVMDEYISDLPHGRRMDAYIEFANLYNEVTGEIVSPVTVRHWRHSAMCYSRHNLQRFEVLSDSQLTEAVKLAEINKIGADQICEWCVENEVRTVSAMRANWLPNTGTPTQTDPPALSGIIRLFGRLFKTDHPQRKRIDEIINELRSYL